jgi:hypothetical protein
MNNRGDKKWKGGVRSKRRVSQIPGANIKEFLVSILSETARPQILYLSLKGEFWERSIALALFAVKRALEWSEILFIERNGFWATVRQGLIFLLTKKGGYIVCISKRSSYL